MRRPVRAHVPFLLWWIEDPILIAARILAMKSAQPTLSTPRLDLRPFRMDDAGSLQALAGDKEIADASDRIPHPYRDGMAEAWIATHAEDFAARRVVTFALALRSSDELVGCCGLTIDGSVNRAEIGYWVGQSYWGSGFASEAASAVLRFGFEELELNRIYGRHFARNPSSGRVMARIGMQREGVARQDAKMWGRYEDVVSYGVLREDWLPSR
ncbi:MAG: GNAT family N-acetyltransferase [Pseudomonadota bacterium]